ncbi:7630_t:CDS:2 [Funneliformis geosporum]|nr:7630_t:CDS:2 [Funneliformis geosporum]
MFTQQTNNFIKKVKTYGEFSEIIEEYHVRKDEIVLNEEIIVEEEEVIEISGVSFQEGCYDLGMKFIEVDYGVSEENAQNQRENFSSDGHEKLVKETWKLDSRKDREHKQLKSQIQELNDQLGMQGKDGLLV